MNILVKKIIQKVNEMVSEKEVMDSLKTVLDPEIGINIVDLGLIYGIEIREKSVKVKMTLTMPGCPMSEYLVESAKNAVSKIAGLEKIEIDLVFDPPWNPEKISAEAKKSLGF